MSITSFCCLYCIFEHTSRTFFYCFYDYFEQLSACWFMLLFPVNHAVSRKSETSHIKQWFHVKYFAKKLQFYLKRLSPNFTANIKRILGN